MNDTSPEPTAQPLAWSHDVAEIPDSGLSRDRAATAAESSAIVQQLRLNALASLSARYRVERLAGGGYRLSGDVIADVEQACVVTLDPIPSHMVEPFDVEFWPVATKSSAKHAKADDVFDAKIDLKNNDIGNEASVFGEPDVEPLANGTIDVGRIVYETFSAALDPFPRKPDAAFEWQDPAEANPSKTNPFAVLSRLKDKT